MTNLDDAMVCSQVLEVLDQQPIRRRRPDGAKADVIELDADVYALLVTVLQVIVGRGNLTLAQEKAQTCHPMKSS